MTFDQNTMSYALTAIESWKLLIAMPPDAEEMKDLLRSSHSRQKGDRI